ncbi:MAG: alpha/beta hydrolase [Gammaproteobacteria bacterium]|nr:alpha/beta hydrolase [Gammaproteobacteria bacterium]
MILRRILPVMLMATLFQGCSVFSLINFGSSSSHYSKTADIEYGNLDRQRLDVYQPVAAKTSAPLVIFFYGGSWDSGSKKHYEFVATSLTRAGYVVVLPDYRLYPEVTFPDYMTDAAMATAWAINHIDEIGGDRQQIYLMGHSAGSQIAALLALDDRYLNTMNISKEQIHGLIGLSGPYDFLPLGTDKLRAIFPEETRPQSQAINFVNDAGPRTLFIHGADDTVVLPRNSKRLAAKMTEQGTSVTLHLYPDRKHASILLALAPRLSFVADTLDDVTRFIDSQDVSL